MDISNAGFLGVALATHAVIGYTLGWITFDAPRAGFVGGLFADVDLLVSTTQGLPLAHRGVTHSALAVGVAVALAAVWGRQRAGAVGVGYVSHLLIDATTPMGIPVAYPLSPTYVGVSLGGHSLPATAFFWICCLALLWRLRTNAS